MVINTHQQFPVGALVQWGEIKTYGVIVASDGKKIKVRWDDAGPPPQFSAENSPLLRIDLAGKVVQRRSNGQSVVAQSRIAQDPPVWACLAFSPSGIPTSVNVPESDLFIPPVTEPVERFKISEIGSTKRYLLRQVAQRYRVQNSQDDLVSLGQSQVSIQPHQVSVVHKVAQNYPHRFMLCDEVGLGKTIEAGMALKELRVKSDVERVLVIAPPNLVRQWQFELRTKFNEEFAVLNTATVNNMRENGYAGNPFAHPDHPNVICSSRWVSGRRWSGLCVEAHWDMIIVDEAHHARRHPDGSTTAPYRLLRDLAPDEQVNRPMLFLTATPMQLHPSELYALVEILDPTLFPSEEDFDEHRKAMPGLSALAQKLSAAGEFPIPGDDSEETERTVRQISEWLEMGEDDVLDNLRSGRDGLRAISEKLSDKHRLSEVMIRNRKSVVGGFMPRAAMRWEVELSPEERAAMDALEDYVRVGYQFAEDADAKSMGFLMVIFQKLTASSIAAVKASLLKRREKVRAKLTESGSSSDDMAEMLDQDASAGDVVDRGATAADFSDRELILLNNAITALDNVGETDSKGRVFVDKLAELFGGEYPDEKVLVFTQFRETQNHLADLIKARGWSVNVFHGGMNPREKDAAIERFRTNSGPQILISTEAGGEGRNLQFAHLLVNYDLPWNPMKVEQRIGRIDRIGQDKPILIFNLWVKDTVEERVLDVLENRIRMFEETVGGLDPILGDEESVETSIEKIMMAAEEEAKEVLDNFDRQIEGKRQDAQEAGDKLGDFIMDTKSYRRDIAETVSGRKSPVDNANFEKFVRQLLLDVNTRVERSEDDYVLTFRGDFHVDNSRSLFPGGPRMRASLHPERRADSENVEFMVFGHKIVETIVERVLSDDYEGNTGARRIVADDRIRPDSGWLFHYRFTISGVKQEERLESVFVSDANGIVEGMGELLVERACRFNREEGVDAGLIPGNLDRAEQIAAQFIIDRQQELQREAQTRAAERVDGEVARLNALYDHRERAAKDRVEATRATLNGIRESDDRRQRRILPVWEANLQRDEGIAIRFAEDRKQRIAEAEENRNPQVSYALTALGRIEIAASA